jgi:hypothetical protein
LFELSVDKNILVTDMYRRGWGVEEAGWRWHQRLFVWEEELHNECCATLNFIFLQDVIPDRWISFDFSYDLNIWWLNQLPCLGSWLIFGC